MLNAIPFLLELLRMDNIAVNGIANNDIGCFLCSFLLFGGGVWLFFLNRNMTPITLSYSVSHQLCRTSKTWVKEKVDNWEKLKV